MELNAQDEQKVGSFFMLADQAMKANNHEDALGYYKKIIEIDPLNPEAWFGKGEASGWLSDIFKNIRLLEMGQGITNAVKFCADDKKDEMLIRGATALNDVASAVYSTAWNFYHENTSIENGKVFFSALDHVLNALELASSLNPKSIKVMESIIIFTNNAGVVFGGSSTQKSNASSLKIKYERLVKELDPNYKLPSSSSCFVVTATMGNEHNVFVADLRHFRDSLLLNYGSGRKLVTWYYKNGPSYADAIGQSRFLRLVAFGLLVLPAYCLAKPMLLLITSHQKKGE